MAEVEKKTPSNLISQYAAEIKGEPQKWKSTRNGTPFVFIIIRGVICISEP